MILTDTGPIVAMLDRADPHHARTRALVNQTSDTLLTTEACLTEAMYLVGRSVGWPGLVGLHRLVIDGVLEMFQPAGLAHSQAFAFMVRYRDQPCDYADATLLVAAEETGLRRIFTIDTHFRAYRLARGEALEMIP